MAMGVLSVLKMKQVEVKSEYQLINEVQVETKHTLTFTLFDFLFLFTRVLHSRISDG